MIRIELVVLLAVATTVLWYRLARRRYAEPRPQAALVLAAACMFVGSGSVAAVATAVVCLRGFFAWWPVSPASAVIYGFLMAIVAGAVAGLAYGMRLVGVLLLQPDMEPFASGQARFLSKGAILVTAVTVLVRFVAMPRIPVLMDPELYTGLVIVPVLAVANLVVLVAYGVRRAPWLP